MGKPTRKEVQSLVSIGMGILAFLICLRYWEYATVGILSGVGVIGAFVGIIGLSLIALLTLTVFVSDSAEGIARIVHILKENYLIRRCPAHGTDLVWDKVYAGYRFPERNTQLHGDYPYPNPQYPYARSFPEWGAKRVGWRRLRYCPTCRAAELYERKIRKREWWRQRRRSLSKGRREVINADRAVRRELAEMEWCLGLRENPTIRGSKGIAAEASK